MKIGVFGTGVVGRTISEKLITLGHEVMMGTRAARCTDADRQTKSRLGNGTLTPSNVLATRSKSMSTGS